MSKARQAFETSVAIWNHEREEGRLAGLREAKALAESKYADPNWNALLRNAAANIAAEIQALISQPTSKLRVEDTHRAILWRLEHHDHVERLISRAEHAYPPTGSDCRHPELWNSGHWRWFTESEKANHK